MRRSVPIKLRRADRTITQSGGADIFTKLKSFTHSAPGERVPRTSAALPIIGILAITAVEGYALNRGINGTALTAALTAIAALGGAGLGRLLK